MANDCLVTKLKGVVNNDSLLKIGEVDVTFDAGSAKSIYLFGSGDSENFTVRVIGDGYIQASASDTTSHGTEITGHGTIWFSSAVTKIRISSKYDLVITIIGKFYGADFTYCQNLRVLDGFIKDGIYHLPRTLTGIKLGNTMNDEPLDLSVLSEFTELLQFEYAYTTDLDLSQLSSKMLSVILYSARWSSPTNRPANATIFGMKAPYDGSIALYNDLDNMLANMANCVMPDRSITIRVTGTTTENTASLAQALKAHGGANLTLIVNNVTY